MAFIICCTRRISFWWPEISCWVHLLRFYFLDDNFLISYILSSFLIVSGQYCGGRVDERRKIFWKIWLQNNRNGALKFNLGLLHLVSTHKNTTVWIRIFNHSCKNHVGRPKVFLRMWRHQLTLWSFTFNWSQNIFPDWWNWKNWNAVM